MKFISCFAFALILLATPVLAQSIPVDIPDTPGESPSDREREKREERFMPFLSRMYMHTTVGASPLLHRDGAVFDTFVEAGFRFGESNSIFVVAGPRIAPQMLDDETGRHRVEGGYVAGLGLEFGFSESPQLENWSLSFATGTWTGDVDMFFTELSPRYIYPLNEYWKLSAGVKASVVTFSQGDVVFFAGPSFGLRRQFGQRRILE